MLDLLKMMVGCFTLAIVVLPVAFLVALSLPQNHEFRQLCLRLCWWGVVVAAVGYVALPLDALPELLIPPPFGFADDLVALGVGWAGARRAMRPAGGASRN